MAIVTQNIVTPAGLATGQVAQATQITPLYAALNNFTIPDSLWSFQTAFADDALYTITVGGTVTKDWAVPISQLKSMKAILPFFWTAGNAPTLTYRVNGAAVTAAQATTNAAGGNGMVIVTLAGRDSNSKRGLLVTQYDDGNTQRYAFPNIDLATTDLSSFGVTVGGVAGAFNFAHVRFFRET